MPIGYFVIGVVSLFLGIQLVDAHLDILSVIILFGAVQGIFLSIYLWSQRKGPVFANRCLALFLIVFAIIMVLDVIYRSGYILKVPHLSMIYMPFTFLQGACMYFYIWSLTNKSRKTSLWHLLHLLPFVISIGCLIPYYSKPTEYKLQFILDSYNDKQDLIQVLSSCSLVLFIIYLSLSYLELKKHTRNILQYFSTTEDKTLDWLRHFFLIGLGILLLCIAITISVNAQVADRISNVLFSIVIYIMAYRGMNQPEIFKDIREEIENEEPLPEIMRADQSTSLKYEKSGLNEEKAKSYLIKLEQVILQEKPYLDPELNLQQLADKMGIPLHQLSQLINQYLSMNFFDLINKKRVEHFKRELEKASNETYSLLGLAYNSGFNSKAAFNSAFKKFTGMTPSEYRMQIKNMQ